MSEQKGVETSSVLLSHPIPQIPGTIGASAPAFNPNESLSPTPENGEIPVIPSAQLPSPSSSSRMPIEKELNAPEFKAPS